MISLWERYRVGYFLCPPESTQQQPAPRVILITDKSTQQNLIRHLKRAVILITPDRSTQQKSDFNHKNESTQQNSRLTGWLNKITYGHVDYGKATVERRKNK